MIGVLIFLVGLYLVWDYKTDISHKIFRKDDQALSILKERYVRGEITDDEFIMKRNNLVD